MSLSPNYSTAVSYYHEKYREDLCARIKGFLAENAITNVIGISGDADSEDKSRTEGIVAEFIEGMSGGGYAILSGGTEGGVPEMAVRQAKRLEIPTIGVFPTQGRKYALMSELDFALETTPPDIGDGTFGTETPTFVNLLDGASVIGGSYGTLTEVTTILKVNVKRLKEKATTPTSAIQPIFLAPISGTGGVADHAYELARIFKRGAEGSLPTHVVTDGSQAAKYLRSKLESKQN